MVFTTKKDPQVESVQSVPLSKIKPLTFKEKKKSRPALHHCRHNSHTRAGRPAAPTAGHTTEEKMAGPSTQPSSVQARDTNTPSLLHLTPRLCKGHQAVSQTLAFSSCSCCPGDVPSLGSGSQSGELLWVSMGGTASEFNFLLFFNWCK